MIPQYYTTAVCRAINYLAFYRLFILYRPYGWHLERNWWYVSIVHANVSGCRTEPNGQLFGDIVWWDCEGHIATAGKTFPVCWDHFSTKIFTSRELGYNCYWNFTKHKLSTNLWTRCNANLYESTDGSSSTSGNASKF